MQIDAGVTALSDCRTFQCLNHIGFADPSADVDLATAARGALGIVSDARAYLMTAMKLQSFCDLTDALVQEGDPKRVHDEPRRVHQQ